MRINAGHHKGRRITVPEDSKSLRPTSDFARQAIFNILQSSVGVEGKRVADICAGSGAWGLEALSRGAAHVTFIENHPSHAKLITQSLTSWREPHGTVLSIDAKKLPKQDKVFDIVFIDPPYHQGLLPIILEQLVSAVWVNHDSVIIIEHEHGEAVTLPQGFTITDERRYGRATLKWLSV